MDGDRIFSTSSAYLAFFIGQHPIEGAKLLRKARAPAKCKFFIWLVLHDRCDMQISFTLGCILSYVVLQAQQEPFGTQTLLGLLKLATRCLGTQMALMLVRGESITLIAQVPAWSFLSLVKS